MLPRCFSSCAKILIGEGDAALERRPDTSGRRCRARIAGRPELLDELGARGRARVRGAMSSSPGSVMIQWTGRRPTSVRRPVADVGRRLELLVGSEKGRGVRARVRSAGADILRALSKAATAFFEYMAGSMAAPGCSFRNARELLRRPRPSSRGWPNRRRGRTREGPASCFCAPSLPGFAASVSSASIVFNASAQDSDLTSALAFPNSSGSVWATAMDPNASAASTKARNPNSFSHQRTSCFRECWRRDFAASSVLTDSVSRWSTWTP